MSQVNPAPHDEDSVDQPHHTVTAFFPAGVDIPTIQRALADAGFRADQVHVLQGERHGDWVRFRRALERVFADETVPLDRIETVLKSGGVVGAAFTGGDEALKDLAVDVLKIQGGQEVRSWRECTIDRL